MPLYNSTSVRKFPSENPIDSLWEQLSSFESITLSERLIRNKSEESGFSIASDKLENKAIALSYCIRNARDNMRVSTESLTTTAITNYYGLLWLTSAIAVATPSIEADLPLIEVSTKRGHGLSNLQDDSAEFPYNEYICITKRGFFKNLVEWLAVISSKEFDSICLDRPISYENIPEDKRALLISLPELFARIPEITSAFEAVTKSDAKNFGLFHASNKLAGAPIGHIGVEGEYSKEHLYDCMIPLKNLVEYRTNSKNRTWAGEQKLFPGQNFFDAAYNDVTNSRAYVSPLSGYFYIAPLLGCINNPLVIHLMLSYHLSILARYRPAIWREILEGKFDEFRILVNAYNKIVGRVAPHLALNIIVGYKNRFQQPGTWW